MKTIVIALANNHFTATFRSEYMADVLKAVSLIEWDKDLNQGCQIIDIVTVIDHMAADCMYYQMSVTYFKERGKFLSAAEAAAAEALAERVAEQQQLPAAPAAPYTVAIDGHATPAQSIGEALDLIEAAGAMILSEDRETVHHNLTKTGEVRYVCGPGKVAILQAGAVAGLTAAAARLFRATGRPELDQMVLTAEQAVPLVATIKALQLRNSYGRNGTPGGMFSYYFPAERPGYLFNLVEDSGHVWLQGTCHAGNLARPLK